MKSSNQDKAEGQVKNLKGMLKTAAGQAVGNPKLEAEGRNDQAEGKIQKKIGEIKKVFGK